MNTFTKSDMEYTDTRYGKNSAEYSIAQKLNDLKNKINDCKEAAVLLKKVCKMETIGYQFLFNNSDENNTKFIVNKIYFTLDNKIKRIQNIRNEIGDFKNVNYEKYKFINNDCFKLLTEGYQMI